MSSRATVLPLLAAVSALFLAATGCSDSGDKGGSDSAKPTSTPTMSGTEGKTLPIETYLMSFGDSRKLEEARGVLAADCMKRFGFDYQPPQSTAHQDDNANAANTAHRYGLTDLASARVRGFRAKDGGPQDKPAQPQLSASESLVLTGGELPPTSDGSTPTPQGAGQSYQGRKIPPGGCLGEAANKLRGKGTFGDSETARGINNGSLAKSRQEHDVKQAISAWSACVKGKGFTTNDPLDPTEGASEYRTPQPTQREIKLATADVECKRKTNLVGIWFAAETALQTTLIEDKAEVLGADKKEQEAMLQRAADVLK